MTRKWWTPQFSLKLILLLTTAVCLYITCWRVTATLGVKVVGAKLAPMHGGDVVVEPKAPFVLSHSAARIRSSPWGRELVHNRTLYLWPFGGVVQLPFGTERVSRMPPAPSPQSKKFLPGQMPPFHGPTPADRIPPPIKLIPA